MANIFTIKIGNPSTLSLYEGELGFHTDTNTLYIGTNNSVTPIGGEGAFVKNGAEFVEIGNLTLTNALPESSGGTGVTKLSDLTFTKDQITDLDLSNYLTEVNWSEVGFEKEGENWSLDINTLKKNGKDVATEDWVKDLINSEPSIDLSDYFTKNDAKETFVNVEGDTMTGTLLLSDSPYLYFRNKNNSNSGEIYCGSFGQLGLIAKGNNENRRELRINSHSLNTNNNSALELIINNSSYKVYHTGWPGDLQLYARATSSGSYYRSIQILGPNTNGVSDRNALRYQTYWGSPYTFTIYHSHNVIYSESEPTQDVFNGMIWLKPAT